MIRALAIIAALYGAHLTTTAIAKAAHDAVQGDMRP
jgi:hypothetical protein